MSGEATDRPRVSFWDASWQRQWVLRALILREFQARFGRHNIGFLWLVVEPLILASVITAIHSASHTNDIYGGIQPYPFTVIGYCLAIIFRNNFGRSEGVLGAAIPLLYHSQITPVAIMTARVICETIGTLTAFAILMTAGIMLGLAEFPIRPLYLFLAIAEISIWSLGLAWLIAAHTHTNHVVGRFVHPVAYFMFPLSGAFFTMDFLPPWAREYMAWNPMMGMMETARYGQFESASPDYMFPGYVIAHCAFTVYWGLLSLRRVRRHIHVA